MEVTRWQKRTLRGKATRERCSRGEASLPQQGMQSLRHWSTRRGPHCLPEGTPHWADVTGWVHSVTSGNMSLPLHFPWETNMEGKTFISPRTLVLSDFIYIIYLALGVCSYKDWLNSSFQLKYLMCRNKSYNCLLFFLNHVLKAVI